MQTYQRILLTTMLVITAKISGMPAKINGIPAKINGMPTKINGMPASENADLQFDILKSNSGGIFTSQMKSANDQARDEELIGDRDKRHIGHANDAPEILINKTQSNETSFEEYEKEYLINLTKSLLEQFLHYDRYLSYLKDENSSVNGGSTSSPDVSPGQPTPLPNNGVQTTPDVRVDSRILQQKLSELQGMNVNQLERVFNSLHRAAKNGVEDPGITSLCCNIG